MDEIRPGVPDIIEPLAAEMERRGLGPKMIADFSQLWSQLEPHSRILPCPLCFAKGYVGRLSVLPKDHFGNTAVGCEGCGAEIVVLRVN